MKQKGGDSNNVISASTELIKSMKDLGESIFNEIVSITHIQSDINNGASVSSTQPVTHGISGPPPFKLPKKL